MEEFYPFTVNINKKKNKISPPKIKVIDLTGNNLREIITPSDGSDPAWSGLLP